MQQLTTDRSIENIARELFELVRTDVRGHAEGFTVEWTAVSRDSGESRSTLDAVLGLDAVFDDEGNVQHLALDMLLDSVRRSCEASPGGPIPLLSVGENKADVVAGHTDQWRVRVRIADPGA